MILVDVGGIRYKHGDRTTEYLIHDVDEANDTKYYGFVDYRGCWVIMRKIDSDGTVRYTVGKKGYSTGWAARAGLSYNTIDAVIP